MFDSVKTALQALTVDGQFMPHGTCYLWEPGLLWTMVVSNIAIFVAYFSIPVAVFLFLRRRPDLKYRGVFYMAGLFILACGLTHLMAAVTVWYPLYYITAALHVLTAVVSVATAILAWIVLPQAVTLPSPGRLRQVLRELGAAQQLAAQDPLTGLLNRRALAALAAQLANRPRSRTAPTVGVVMIDLDTFKDVNDRFGHGMGDALLRHVAEVLTRCADEDAGIVRFGGDEFLVVLPGASLNDAEAAAEALCRAVGVSPIWYEGQTVRVTASAGVAAQRGASFDLDGLIRRADRACYAAKKAGRARVMVDDGSTPIAADSAASVASPLALNESGGA